jgi:hypothetical protein
MKTSTVHPNKSTAGGNHAMTAPPIPLALPEKAKKSAEETLTFKLLSDISKKTGCKSMLGRYT